MPVIREILREILYKSDMKKSNLANFIGIRRETLFLWISKNKEVKKNIYLNRIYALAKKYGINPSEDKMKKKT
jgi:DNA-binding XRE family transcriptional regulator